jgi:hypothetical protein
MKFKEYINENDKVWMLFDINRDKKQVLMFKVVSWECDATDINIQPAGKIKKALEDNITDLQSSTIRDKKELADSRDSAISIRLKSQIKARTQAIKQAQQQLNKFNRAYK